MQTWKKSFKYLFALFAFVSLTPPNSLTASEDFDLSQIAHTFPARGFETEIEFWKKVFAEYDSRHVLFHDRDDLRLIYKVERFRKGPERDPDEYRRQKKVLEKEWDGLEKVFEDIRRYGPDAKNLGSQHRHVIEVLVENGYSLTPPVLRELSENFRMQRGVKNRFRDGLIRSGMFLDYISDVFQRYGVPAELALLPHVESSFDYNAYSRAGAAGIWQFTRATGRIHLRINSTVDERLDPLAATEAAAKTLLDNYQALGSWPLALVAYNHGKYGMLRAQKRHGSSLRRIVDNYRSRTFGFASRNFYPEFLAAVEIHHNRKKYFGVLDIAEPLTFDPVRVDHFYDLGYFTSVEGITPEVLLAYNPHFKDTLSRRNAVLPAGFEIRVPTGKGAAVEEVLASARPTHRGLIVASDGSSRYRVNQGDSLGSIASRFSTSTSHLQRLNGIRNPNRIYPGQLLLISRGSGLPDRVSVSSDSDASLEIPTNYTVKAGESLAEIAGRLGTSVAALQRENNLANPNLIQPGQELSLPEGAVPEPTEYRVQRGDTLAAIAARFGTTVSALRQANRLGNPDRLQIGQVLLISGPSKPRYTVRRGDTLAKIAGKFGTSVSRLKETNRIRNANRIQPGQELVIP